MDHLALSPDAIQALAKDALCDRIIGCLVGSALGDAIGLYTEFLPQPLAAAAYPDRKFALYPASAATEMRRDAHRNCHWPGDWTDDTDHALLVLLSALHKDCKELNPHDFASRLSTWVQAGLLALDTLPLGLGRTVGAIVRTKRFIDEPESVARAHWATTKYQAAPNGSLMRTHPLGLLCLGKSMDETFDVAASYSVVTHVDPRCIISCAIGTALVRGLARREVTTETDVDKVIEQALVWWPGYRKKQLAEHPGRNGEPDLDLDEFWRHARVDDLSALELNEERKIGYVYKTFGSGIHLLRLAMRESHDTSRQLRVFEVLIVDLIMRGGDADTNACFAGALLGAMLGFKALPPHWRDGLHHRQFLLHKAQGLCQMLGVAHGSYRGSEDKDTAPDGGRGFPSEKEMDGRAQAFMVAITQREQERDKREAADKKKVGGWRPWK